MSVHLKYLNRGVGEVVQKVKHLPCTGLIQVQFLAVIFFLQHLQRVNHWGLNQGKSYVLLCKPEYQNQQPTKNTSIYLMGE